MDAEFEIPEGMSGQKLAGLIKNIKNITGAEIKRKVSTTLVTDDVKAAQIMKVLLGDDASALKTDEKKRSYVVGKKAAGKPAPDILPASETSKTWELLDENDQVLDSMTIEGKNMRLAGGKFPTNARLRYRRSGVVSFITGEYGKPQGMKL